MHPFAEKMMLAKAVKKAMGAGDEREIANAADLPDPGLSLTDSTNDTAKAKEDATAKRSMVLTKKPKKGTLVVVEAAK